MGRILCAWSPHWALANWYRRHPSSAPPEPLVLVSASKGVRRIHDLDEAALALGLFAGQKVADAMALVPDLHLADAEPEADDRALAALVDWCVRFSPAVAPAPPDGLFLDISGVDHLWGDEPGLMQDLAARLQTNGLGFRLAIADTPGAAWALARFGPAGVIVPPGEQARALAPLPPESLRFDPADTAQIRRLGIHRLDQIMDLPRAPLTRRFGVGVLTRLDQALGRSREALTYRRPPSPWFARLALAEPVSTLEDLARITTDVTARLCERLETAGQGARRFELTFHRVDGRPESLSLGLAAAARDPARIARLFHPRLETIDPGFGIEVVTLRGEAVETITGRQIGLEAGQTPAPEDGLVPLLDRLTNRLGPDRVWRSTPVDSHVPERSARPGPVLSRAATRSWDPLQPRPLRLFRSPEPVEGVIALTPDDPPRQFRWRGQLHRVRHAEGPERIGEEWWRGPIEGISISHVRDYYRLEDEAGARFWIFRAGLYDPAIAARWWMHGLFS